MFLWAYKGKSKLRIREHWNETVKPNRGRWGNLHHRNAMITSCAKFNQDVSKVITNPVTFPASGQEDVQGFYRGPQRYLLFCNCRIAGSKL